MHIKTYLSKLSISIEFIPHASPLPSQPHRRFRSFSLKYQYYEKLRFCSPQRFIEKYTFKSNVTLDFNGKYDRHIYGYFIIIINLSFIYI